MNLLRTGLALMIALAVSSASWADEEKVPLDKVPAKVKDTVKAKFPDAEIVEAEKETVDGKTIYELNIKVKGQEIDVELTEDGKIIAIEKTIAAKDLPKVVAEALDKKYPKAEITKAEEITKDDKTSYEMLIKVGDKKLEVVFDAQGKFIEEEDKSKDKDDDDKKKDKK